MSSGVSPRVRVAFFRIAIALSILGRLTTTHAENVWFFPGLVARQVEGRGQASHPLTQPRAQGRAASTYSSRRPARPMRVRPGFAGANPRHRPQAFDQCHCSPGTSAPTVYPA